MPTDLSVVDGAEAGAWIAPQLEGGFGGKVKQLVPNGYDAYIRVLHPALDRDGELRVTVSAPIVVPPAALAAVLSA